MATRRKQGRWENREGNRERLARSIAGRITRAQHRIAGRLNRLAARATRRQLALLFALIIAAMAAYCLYLILESIL